MHFNKLHKHISLCNWLARLQADHTLHHPHNQLQDFVRCWEMWKSKRWYAHMFMSVYSKRWSAWQTHVSIKFCFHFAPVHFYDAQFLTLQLFILNNLSSQMSCQWSSFGGSIYFCSIVTRQMTNIDCYRYHWVIVFL